MSLKYAILGLLTFEPMSGYTLKSRYFDRSIAHFWPADQAQIYRTLQALEGTGEVESRTVASDTRPNSRVYSITAAGGAALHQWVASAQDIAVQKEGFLVQLYFGRVLSKEQILAVVQARRAEHERLLNYYETMAMPPAESEDMQRQMVFGSLTLDYARRRERMMLEWLDACLATLAAIGSPEI